jgi:hypothetical protein
LRESERDDIHLEQSEEREREKTNAKKSLEVIQGDVRGSSSNILPYLRRKCVSTTFFAQKCTVRKKKSGTKKREQLQKIDVKNERETREANVDGLVDGCRSS